MDELISSFVCRNIRKKNFYKKFIKDYKELKSSNDKYNGWKVKELLTTNMFY